MIIRELAQPAQLLVKRHSPMAMPDKTFAHVIGQFHKRTLRIHRAWIHSRPHPDDYRSAEREATYSSVLEVAWSAWDEIRSNDNLSDALKLQHNYGQPLELRRICSAILHAVHTTSFDERDKVLQTIANNVLVGHLAA